MDVHPRLTRLSFALEATGEWFSVHRIDGKLVVGELRRDAADRQDGTLRVLRGDYPGQPLLLRPRHDGQRPSPAALVHRGQGRTGARPGRRPTSSSGPRGRRTSRAITCATPIIAKDGSLVGVLGASFDVIELSTYLQGLKVGEHGYAFVVECRERRDPPGDRPQGPEDPRPAGPGRDRPDGRRTCELVPTEELADQRVAAFLREVPARLDPSPVEGDEAARLRPPGRPLPRRVFLPLDEPTPPTG